MDGAILSMDGRIHQWNATSILLTQPPYSLYHPHLQWKLSELSIFLGVPLLCGWPDFEHRQSADERGSRGLLALIG